MCGLRLGPASWKDVKRYASDICAMIRLFGRVVSARNFATLMRVTRPTMISAVDCDKRDRRGWVVLERAESQSNLAL